MTWWGANSKFPTSHHGSINSRSKVHRKICLLPQSAMLVISATGSANSCAVQHRYLISEKWVRVTSNNNAERYQSLRVVRQDDIFDGNCSRYTFVCLRPSFEIKWSTLYGCVSVLFICITWINLMYILCTNYIFLLSTTDPCSELYVGESQRTSAEVVTAPSKETWDSFSNGIRFWNIPRAQVCFRIFCAVLLRVIQAMQLL